MKQVAKFAIAAIGAIAQGLNLGILSGSTATWAGIAISIATALGVYTVPNKKA